MGHEGPTIEVLFFGPAKARAGVDRARLTLAAGTTLGELRSELERRVGPLAPGTALVVNGEFVRGDGALADGDEVAVLPPVSGG